MHFSGIGRTGAACLVFTASLISFASAAQVTVNVDVQSGAHDLYSGPDAAGNPNPVWNSMGSDTVRDLRSTTGAATSIGVRAYGASGRFDSGSTTHDLLEDALYRVGSQEATVEISGLSATRKYDVYVYTGVEGGRYRIGGEAREALLAVDGSENGLIAPGAVWQEGKNHVLFQAVTPSSSGKIFIRYSDNPANSPTAGDFAGFTVKELGNLNRHLNVDIQNGSGDAYSGPSAFDSGTPSWNHVSADSVQRLQDASGTVTPIGLQLFGASGRFTSGATTHGLLRDALYRSSGAEGNARITGLTPGTGYDLVIYTGVEGGRYRIDNLVRDGVYAGTGPGGDAAYAPGAAFVEGKNFVVFRSVNSDAHGNILLRYSNSPNAAAGVSSGNLAGLSIGPAGTFLGPNPHGGSPPTNPTYAIHEVFNTGNSGVRATISGLQGGATLLLFHLGGDPPSASGGILNMLGFSLPITSARTENGKLLLNSTFQLPPELFTDPFNNPIAQSVSLEVDMSGNISVVGGAIFIPELRLAKTMALRNLSVRFDFNNNTVGGGVEVSVGPSGRFVGGNLVFVNGQLNSLTVGGSSLAIPVGGGAFLDIIQGSGFGLADPRGQWSVQGRMVINAGRPFQVGGQDVVPATVDANGTYFSDRRFAVTGTGKIFNKPVGQLIMNVEHNRTTVGADVDFLGIYQSRSRMNITANGVTGSGVGRLGIPHWVGFGLGGRTFGNARSSFDEKGFRGSVSLQVSPHIPEKCVGGYHYHRCWTTRGCFLGYCWNKRVCVRVNVPRRCIPAIPARHATFAYEYRAQDDRFTFGRQTAGLTGDPQTGFRPAFVEPNEPGVMTFLTNWKRIDSASSVYTPSRFAHNLNQQQTTFTIPGGAPGAIFRLAYTNQVANGAGLQVTLPSGTVIDVANGELPTGFVNVAGYGVQSPDIRESIVFLFDPVAGDYTVSVPNPAPLGDYGVEVLLQDQVPEVSIEQINGPTSNGIVDIEWVVDDLNGEAMATFFLERDSEGNEGIQIGQVTVTNSTPLNAVEQVQIDLSQIDPPPGDYFFMIRLDDGANAPQFVYSDTGFTIENPDAPEPVEYMASKAGDGGFSLSWIPSLSSNIAYYRVVYSEDVEGKDFDQGLTVGGDVTDVTISGLKNGQPYLVAVLAGATNGLESIPFDIHRVIPTRGPGQTPPKIVSTPDTDATAGFLYSYFAIGFDGDAERLEGTAPPINGDTVTNASVLNPWSLETAPAGMSIDPSGLLTWTPTVQQIGEHEIVLALSKENNMGFTNSRPLMIDRQRFTITVMDTNNLNGLEPHPYQFISRPPLITRDLTNYVYVPELFAGDTNWTLQLVFGPQGMSVSTNREVVWNVPEDSTGEFVWIRATTSDGVELDQEFFVHVALEWNRLPEDLRVAHAENGTPGRFLNWIGDSQQYWIQRKNEIGSGNWQTVAGPLAAAEPNIYVDDQSTGTNRVFYRIVEGAAP